MKNLKFLLVLVFVCFAGLNSCSEDDVLSKNEYNYNSPVITSKFHQEIYYKDYHEMYWENKDFFDEMSRDEYASLPNKLRNIIFSNISERKVFDLWQKKFENLINTNYLTQHKKELIRTLRNKLKPEFFKHSELSSTFSEELFLDFKKYDFTDEEIFISVYTLYDINDDGTLQNINFNRQYQLTHADAGDCHIWSCYLPIACGGNECDSDCEVVDECGLFGNWDCDGECT